MLSRRMLLSVIGVDVSFMRDIALPTEQHGSDYGGWVICSDAVAHGAIVYSFGIGTDDSFDRSLIRTHGIDVHAFDPTPKSIAWCRKRKEPAAFHFHPIGIAPYDGTATFHAPLDPDHSSYSMASRSAQVDTVVAEVHRLATIMNELQHSHVDILKLDVEGAEYDVIEDLRRSQLDVRQILVEFHHHLHGFDVGQTQHSVEVLKDMGYRAFYVSPAGREFGFIRNDRF